MGLIVTSKGDDILVDDDQVEHFSRHTWRLNEHGYACRTIRLGNGRAAPKTAEFIHRLVSGALPRQIVDHINGIRTDNRRENLRIVSALDSSRNVHFSKNIKAGGFKGVYLVRKSGRWAAHIGAGLSRRSDGRSRHVHLGCYDFAEDAARAYDRAAVLFFGEHAALNFPTEEGQRMVELQVPAVLERLLGADRRAA